MWLLEMATYVEVERCTER